MSFSVAVRKLGGQKFAKNHYHVVQSSVSRTYYGKFQNTDPRGYDLVSKR